MSENDELHLPEDLKEKMFMIRNCAWYDEEYSDCKSVRGRFHQYFVYGNLKDCSPWKRDSDNCVRWRDNKDRTSLEELVNSEDSRRQSRREAFLGNSVWENRTEPPANWSSPLPDWMIEDYKTSYLGIKAQEVREVGIENVKKSMCWLM